MISVAARNHWGIGWRATPPDRPEAYSFMPKRMTFTGPSGKANNHPTRGGALAAALFSTADNLRGK
jgi:hypothetical protein